MNVRLRIACRAPGSGLAAGIALGCRWPARAAEHGRCPVAACQHFAHIIRLRTVSNYFNNIQRPIHHGWRAGFGFDWAWMCFCRGRAVSVWWAPNAQRNTLDYKHDQRVDFPVRVLREHAFGAYVCSDPSPCRGLEPRRMPALVS
jgi:hypothetical protein